MLWPLPCLGKWLPPVFPGRSPTGQVKEQSVLDAFDGHPPSTALATNQVYVARGVIWCMEDETGSDEREANKSSSFHVIQQWDMVSPLAERVAVETRRLEASTDDPHIGNQDEGISGMEQ